MAQQVYCLKAAAGLVASTSGLHQPGALLPFTSREDVDFFSHLEMHLRQDHPPLAGRDHMAFRGAYYPVSCYP